MRLFPRSLATTLCVSLLTPPAPLAAQSPSVAQTSLVHPPKTRPAYQAGQLQGDARILHALNRFTFGLRPGDLEVVRSMGLEKWFDEQLHPERLDISDLNARLAAYPAMQWNTQDLLYRLPSNALIRQAINGKIQVPERGVLHAIYENEIERISAKQQAQAVKKELVLNQPASVAMPASVSMNTPAANATSTNASSMNSAIEIAAELEKTENSTSMAKEPSPTAPAQGNAGQTSMAIESSPPNTPPVSETAINAVLALPSQQRVDRLAMMRQPQFDGFLKALRPLQRNQLTADLNPEQKEIVAALESPERVVAEELIAERLTRDIYSSAQLQEVMTDFWLNHFNVYIRKNETMPYELVSYERDVIRPRALGKFEDLLEATAHSPAMLMYLDNAESIGPDSMTAERAEMAATRRPGNQKKVRQGLNENYARELMELHTVGVNGGYTQADVTQVARILTGWTIEQPQRGGGFEFDPNRHEPGTKKALNQKFKDHGELEGRELLHFLATRPATAQFISRKLAIRFVSDDPPQSLVDRMAKSYLSSSGDISVVLKTLFHSPEFWSTSVYRAKVKTPLEYVVSALRASDANIGNLRPISNAMREMGMPLYGCVPPTGYKWDAADWVSTGALVNRMNFALTLASNRLPGLTASWNSPVDSTGGSMLAMSAPNLEAEESRLESLLIAGGISDSTRAAVLEQFQQQITQNDTASAQMISAQARPAARAAAATSLERQDQVLTGLLIGSPEFQRR
jgi:uncharacterized protein (DUF1800 family)